VLIATSTRVLDGELPNLLLCLRYGFSLGADNPTGPRIRSPSGCTIGLRLHGPIATDELECLRAEFGEAHATRWLRNECDGTHRAWTAVAVNEHQSEAASRLAAAWNQTTRFFEWCVSVAREPRQV
jgi:hypothetical protein